MDISYLMYTENIEHLFTIQLEGSELTGLATTAPTSPTLYKRDHVIVM